MSENPFDRLFPRGDNDGVEVHAHSLDMETIARIIPGFADVQARINDPEGDTDEERATNRRAAMREVEDLLKNNLADIIMESQLQNMLTGDPTSPDIIREDDAHATLGEDDHTDCHPDSPCRGGTPTVGIVGMRGGYRMNDEGTDYDAKVQWFRAVGPVSEDIYDTDGLIEHFELDLTPREFDSIIEKLINLRRVARQYADDVITGKRSADEPIDDDE